MQNSIGAAQTRDIRRSADGLGQWWFWPYCAAMMLITVGAAIRFAVLGRAVPAILLMCVFLPRTLAICRPHYKAWRLHRNR